MVKVTKVKPALVPEWWEKIEPAIRAGLPPTLAKSKETMDYVLTMLVQDIMQLWLMADDDLKPMALAVTHIVKEPGFNVKNLLIFSLVSFTHVEDKDWKVGFELIERFAKDSECQKILAYTNVKRVIDIAIANGATADYVVITKEVSNGR